MHTVHLWETWSTLTDCVRAGGPRKRRETGDRGLKWINAFIGAMHFYAAGRAPAVVNAVGAGRVRRMLDVGGGSGAYSIAFAQANPNLRADILDLAPVLAIARGHIQQAGLSKRIRTKPGDLRADALGKRYDLVLISAICHMLGPEENRDLFRRAFQALAPGGRVAVRDFILNPAKTAPRGAALFSLNMLVGTANGASYSQREYTAWLREAGFDKVNTNPAGRSRKPTAARHAPRALGLAGLRQGQHHNAGQQARAGQHQQRQSQAARGVPHQAHHVRARRIRPGCRPS